MHSGHGGGRAATMAPHSLLPKLCSMHHPPLRLLQICRARRAGPARRGIRARLDAASNAQPRQHAGRPPRASGQNKSHPLSKSRLERVERIIHHAVAQLDGAVGALAQRAQHDVIVQQRHAGRLALPGGGTAEQGGGLARVGRGAAAARSPPGPAKESGCDWCVATAGVWLARPASPGVVAPAGGATTPKAAHQRRQRARRGHHPPYRRSSQPLAAPAPAAPPAPALAPHLQHSHTQVRRVAEAGGGRPQRASRLQWVS